MVDTYCWRVSWKSVDVEEELIERGHIVLSVEELSVDAWELRLDESTIEVDGAPCEDTKLGVDGLEEPEQSLLHVCEGIGGLGASIVEAGLPVHGNHDTRDFTPVVKMTNHVEGVHYLEIPLGGRLTGHL